MLKKHLDLLPLPDFASIGPTGFCTKHKHRQKFQNGNNSAKETGDCGGWCLWQDLPPHRLQQVRPLCGLVVIILLPLIIRDEFPKEYVPTVFENYVTDIEVAFFLLLSDNFENVVHNK